MKTISIEKIAEMGFNDLTTIIDTWSNYDTNTVTLAYAELLRNNDALPDSQLLPLQAFCKKNNVADINILLNNLLNEIGYKTYESYVNSVAGKNAVETIIDDSYSIETTKYPALRMVIGYLKTLAYIVGLISIIIMVVTFQTMGDQMRWLLIGSQFIIGSVTALLLFAMAETITVVIDIEANTRKSKS